MDATQILVALLGGGVVGVVVKALIEQWNLSRRTRAADRRRETDRADEAERDNRMLKESLAVHRRIIIDAPCLGPSDLPQWPSTSTTRRKHE